jgi:hypothetical protein
MPFKFWKRDKPEKEKGSAESKKGGEKPAPGSKAASETEAAQAPDATPTTGPEAAASETAVSAAEKPPEPAPSDLEAAVAEIHAGLVDLGLTIAGTKAVFAKRVAMFPGGTGTFLATYREKPYRAGTRILADWLGFRAPADFDPEKLLADVNLRLSSFKLSVQMTDLTWLDQELSLRKARLRLGEAERVVRFKDARDFIRGVNEMIAARKLTFLELETWSRDYAFFLVREPKWEKLAATKLVVVKAPQTAVGAECPECGAPVGMNWRDCLSCGAVFETD